MNKPSRPDRPSDIDALFKAQNITAPSELDDFILAEARQAVDASTENSQLVVPGARYRSLLAAAAAVLITIGIAPMLMQSPESTLEPSSLESDTASFNTEVSAKPMTMADTHQDGVQAPDSVQLAEQPITESLTTATSATLQTASSRMSQRKSAPISNSEATTMSAADESDSAAGEDLAGGAAGDLAGGSVGGSVGGSEDVSGLRLEQPQQQKSAELSLSKQTDRVTPASIAPPKPAATPPTIFETMRSNVYRRSPESWVREMQRLESENQMAKAHIEYDQFRKRYPRFETDYRPKDMPRNSPTVLPTD